MCLDKVLSRILKINFNSLELASLWLLLIGVALSLILCLDNVKIVK